MESEMCSSKKKCNMRTNRRNPNGKKVRPDRIRLNDVFQTGGNPPRVYQAGAVGMIVGRERHFVTAMMTDPSGQIRVNKEFVTLLAPGEQ